MKIQPVSTKIQTQKKRQNNFGNQDLSSFQENTQTQQNSFTSKNASDAIKSSFLSNVSFQGHTESLKREDCSYGSRNFICGTSGAVHINLTDPKKELNTHKIKIYGSTSSQESVNQELISHSSRYYPNSSIENTAPHRTGYETERVYFADPEEKVNNQTKRDNDYIVYDNRPIYPKLEDIKRSYLFCDSTPKNYWEKLEVAKDYGQHFKTIAEYYYRLESADKRHIGGLIQEKNEFEPEYKLSLKYKNDLDEKTNELPWEDETVKEEKAIADYFFNINKQKYDKLSQDIGYYENRIEFSKKQQKKAIQAFKIFNEVGLMMYERDSNRKKLYNTKQNIKDKEYKIRHLDQELEELNNKKNEIKEQLSAANALKKINEKRVNEEENTGYTYKSYEQKQEEKAQKDFLASLSKEINKLEDKQTKTEIKIEQLEKEKTDAENYISEAKKEIPELGRKIVDKANEIKRYYHKMEDFYKNNIEEWQCYQ